VSRYRCKGCGEYRARPEYRRVGLSSVCSDGCFLEATGRGQRPSAAPRPAHDDLPPTVRAQVTIRDRDRCRFCGAHDDLHLHHINYRSQGVDHSPQNLILLCALHHRLVHSNKKYWQPVLRAYIWRTYVEGKRVWLPQLELELRTAGLI
jgi:hypothetical protein